MNNPILTPRRPYILRAFYDWLVENALTPHLVVNATLPMVEVPQDYVKDGQIVLNISPRAVADLSIESHQIYFNARFGGHSMSVVVPMYAAMAIYARENGAGTMFEPEPSYDRELDELEKKANDSARVIGLVEEAGLVEEMGLAEETSESDESDEVDTGDATQSLEKTKKSSKSRKSKKGPPNLTVVK